MKKKKVISAIVLFAFTLSSCKQCPKPKPNTLNRTTPDLITIPKEIRPTPILRRLDLNLTKLDGLIERLRDEPKAAFKPTSKALKHAADVISNPASANRSTFSVAKGFSSEVEGFTNDVRNGNAHAAPKTSSAT